VGRAALGLVDRHARREYPNTNSCDAAPDDELGHGVGRALDDDAEKLHVDAPIESSSPAEPVAHEDNGDAADERRQLIYSHDCALQAGVGVIEGYAELVIGTYQVGHDSLVVAKEREANRANHGDKIHQQLALQTALESGPERRHIEKGEHFPKCTDQCKLGFFSARNIDNQRGWMDVKSGCMQVYYSVPVSRRHERMSWNQQTSGKTCKLKLRKYPCERIQKAFLA